MGQISAALRPFGLFRQAALAGNWPETAKCASRYQKASNILVGKFR